MQFGFGVGPDTSWMREELTKLGVEELKTPEDVDRVMKEYTDGTMLMVINSVCGCAAGNARPGVEIALEKTSNKPDHLVTVFAGQDKEATERAREYFSEYPPSSPAFAYFVNGEIKAMVPRHRIEGRTREEVSKDLLMVFDAFAEEESKENA
ncbi:BrxA/BrxB family bacilliredoxin [Rhodohalobacter sp. SW132]|uniref:BrxA/BrxB family bacilliredoxin n=1 Tax=Rhodohalobacter sp. SW132 TaxID=2293433 RepID=UPI000E264D79|nr:BrxA/BrxB family bacilliredoxin [Rhodohalobacter sp. SW132]REL24591.1 BrxA/BrxB family bacilliredoxin [Rhodohalobacter sp. SW132]